MPDGAVPPGGNRAWTWQGSPDPLALVLRDRPTPRPAAGEALVRNAAIGLNPVDWKVLGGDLVDWTPGHVPGVDGAGTVVAIGDGVERDWLGARVAYHQNLAAPGSYADHVAIKARALLRMPDALAFDVAAGVPCPALTAWLALAKLPPCRDDALLIAGAGGGVGNYLVQLAIGRGWRVTTMSHPRHWDRLRALGAADCLGWEIDGTAAAARYAAAIDTVGPDHAAGLAPMLRANGHLVCIQGRVVDWPDPPFQRTVSLHEVALGALHRHGDDADWHCLTQAGEAILAEIAAGRLRPEPILSDGFDRLPQRLDGLRHRDFTGKPVILTSL